MELHKIRRRNDERMAEKTKPVYERRGGQGVCVATGHRRSFGVLWSAAVATAAFPQPARRPADLPPQVLFRRPRRELLLPHSKAGQLAACPADLMHLCGSSCHTDSQGGEGRVDFSTLAPMGERVSVR